MRIVISGANGLIGQALCEHFAARGDEVIRLVRPGSSGQTSDNSIVWDPAKEILDIKAIEGVDGIIHLSGASIAGKRWSKNYKAEILNSRVISTRFLAQSILKLNVPPKVFICASAIGIYGNQMPNKTLDEASPVSDDFLANVCREWEKAAQAASGKTRVVHLRFGVVLSKKGGALKQMLLPFQLGLGGKLGSGRQIFSWIALKEIPLVTEFIVKSGVKGAINCVSPNPVSNAEFTRNLGKTIKRPTIFPVPSFGIKILFGEMGESLLLGGAKVLPKKLLESGYRFKYPMLQETLDEVFS